MRFHFLFVCKNKKAQQEIMMIKVYFYTLTLVTGYKKQFHLL